MKITDGRNTANNTMSVSPSDVNLKKCKSIYESIAVCANGTTMTLAPLAFKNSQNLWWATQEKIRGIRKPEANLVSSDDMTAFMRDGIFVPQG